MTAEAHAIHAAQPAVRRQHAQIRSVETCLVRMPLVVPAAFATRAVTARDYVLVRVRSADGIAGIGLTYCGNKAGTVVQEAVTALLGPLLIGRSRHQIEGLWELMYRESLLHGRTGAVMRGLSALDIALWDLCARSAGLPLWQYLGADCDGTVPCYASGGYYRPGKDADELAAEMRSYVERGFRSVKMKVGLLDIAAEERRLQRVREAVGRDINVFLDANNAWQDLLTALPFVRRFEPFAPGWLEEPFSPDDIESHARLALATSIPIATGEIEAGRWRFRSVLDARAAHVLQTDALVCGGITEWRRIAALASAYGVPVCPHAWHDVHAHLVASTHNAPYAEYFIDETIVMMQPILDRRMEMKDGRLVLPLEPGLGFEFDEACIASRGESGWISAAG